MRCTIYRSARQEYTYLYLAEGQEYDDLPENLRGMLGEAVEVMRLDLDRTARLARADVTTVRRALSTQGFYLQLPPRHPLEDEIEAGLRGNPVKRD